MEKIRLSLPDMVKIWEHSTIAQNGLGAIQHTVQWQLEYLEGIRDGIYTLDSVVAPEMFQI